MEKFKAFLYGLKPWQIFTITVLSSLAVVALVVITPYLRQKAKISLGSNVELTIEADKQDSLGVFSDSRFTIRSNQDLSVESVKQNLVIDPPTEVKIDKIASRQFQITPKTALAQNTLYNLTINSQGKTYTWAFQTKNPFRVLQTLPSDRTTNIPLNTGIEIVFSHDNLQDFEKNISISPKVDGRFEHHGRVISFVPTKLLPHTLYTVTVSKNIKLAGTSDSLQSDKSFQFETADNAVNNYTSLFNFSRIGYEFATSETPTLDLYAGSFDITKEIKVTVFQFPSEKSFVEAYKSKLLLPQWATYTKEHATINKTGLTQVSEFTVPVQQSNYLGFVAFPQVLPKGYYLVSGTNSSSVSESLVQVTDISAFLSTSGTKTLVWVNRIGGKAIKDATVSIATQDAKTNDQGVAFFDTPQSSVTTFGDLLSVKSNADTLFIPVIDNRLYYGDFDWITTRRQTDKYWSYLYLDKPVYKPSDTVNFWGLLRDRDNLNKKLNVKVTLESSNYSYSEVGRSNVLYQKEFSTSDIGTFIGDMSFKNLTAGWYNLTVKIDDQIVINSGVSIESYIKPAYEISFAPVKAAVFAGDTIEYQGKAAFFEGTPVSNLGLKTFGAHQSTLKTDQNGSFKYLLPTTASDSNASYNPRYEAITVSPEKAEEGDISGTASVAVFNSSLYLKTKTDTNDNNTKVTLNLNNIDLDKYARDSFSSTPSYVDSPVSGKTITGKLIEKKYESVQVGTYYDFISKLTLPKYEYRTLDIPLSDISVTTDASGQAIYEFTTEKSKYYSLSFEVRDDQSRLTQGNVFVYGTDFAPYQDNRLVLEESKKEDQGSYLIDEPVTLTLKQNSDKLVSGDYLFFFAQRGINAYSVSDNPVLSFKFADSFVPNVYVQAVYFNGKTYQETDSTYLRFNTDQKKLSLSINLDKETYKPADTAKITVIAKSADNKPQSAVIGLNLIDEAMYKLGESYADPLSSLYRSLNSDIISTYLSHQYPPQSGGAEGGGCFLGDTKILLPGHQSKNIEDIKIGDLIQTRQSLTSPILVSAKVTAVQKHLVSGYLLINHHLKVTSEHNLFVNGRWMVASDIKLGDHYLSQNDSYLPVTSIEKLSGSHYVYNFTVEKYHTYFADGFFVHNDKGRSLFVDTAFFGELKTGIDGKATADIKLPDNITSWRITAQGFTSDLKAGINTKKLPVSLLFFIDVSSAETYLVGDKPYISVRVYGSSLNDQDTSTVNVAIPELGFAKSFTAKAFENTTISLGDLKEGKYTLTVDAKSGNLTDKLTKNFSVITSRLSATKSEFTPLSTTTKPLGSSTGLTKLIFSDQSSGRYFSTLLSLMSGNSARIDQKVASIVSAKLLKQYFNFSVTDTNANLSVYWKDNGGYGILPYSDADLQTSALVSCIGGDAVDNIGLTAYFYKQFTKAQDLHTVALSLLGLSCQKEPVLLTLKQLSKESKVTPEDKVLLALAEAKIGDFQSARQSLDDILTNFSTTENNLTHISISQNKDDNLFSTALVAATAAIVGDNRAPSLFDYTTSNMAEETLQFLPQLIYLVHQIPTTQSDPVSFTYEIDGLKTARKLAQGEAFELDLPAEKLDKITFTDISGNVGLTTVFSTSLDTNTAKPNADLKISRTYSVDDKAVTDLSSSDLVKVTLNYQINSNLQDGCYQITEFLPTGLKPITNIYSLYSGRADIVYPYDVDGQKVSYCVSKSSQNKPISFYARVSSPGTYKAEGALIQSSVSSSIVNFSPPGTINIK